MNKVDQHASYISSKWIPRCFVVWTRLISLSPISMGRSLPKLDSLKSVPKNIYSVLSLTYLREVNDKTLRGKGGRKLYFSILKLAKRRRLPSAGRLKGLSYYQLAYSYIITLAYFYIITLLLPVDGLLPVVINNGA